MTFTWSLWLAVILQVRQDLTGQLCLDGCTTRATGAAETQMWLLDPPRPSAYRTLTIDQNRYIHYGSAMFIGDGRGVAPSP